MERVTFATSSGIVWLALAVHYAAGLVSIAAGTIALSVAKGGQLHPLQQAFVDHGAFQCGYCTPGMILEAYALLLRRPDPTEVEIADALEGNICRCGTYARVIAAVRQASRAMTHEGG